MGHVTAVNHLGTAAGGYNTLVSGVLHRGLESAFEVARSARCVGHGDEVVGVGLKTRGGNIAGNADALSRYRCAAVASRAGLAAACRRTGFASRRPAGVRQGRQAGNSNKGECVA